MMLRHLFSASTVLGVLVVALKHAHLGHVGKAQQAVGRRIGRALGKYPAAAAIIDATVLGDAAEDRQRDRMIAAAGDRDEAGLMQHNGDGYSVTPSGADLLKRLADLQPFAARWVSSQAKKKQQAT